MRRTSLVKPSHYWSIAVAIFDLYSKRQKRIRGEVPDVYTYDDVPSALRVQIIKILEDSCNEFTRFSFKGICKKAVEILCNEYGVFTLISESKVMVRGYERNYAYELATFLLEEQNVEQVLDVIEISFKIIVYACSDYNIHIANNAITELNDRFREHGVGYQFENGEIIRVDSEFVHHEVVKPALRILSEPDYQGAQEEFLRAHEHYRKGNMKEALNEALKSFESTLKIVCNKKSWPFEANATSSRLIDICFEKELIPLFWKDSMSGLRSLLKSGVPTARNRLGGHGQGSTPTEVPDYITSYVLHMTASAIVFLATAEKRMPL